MKKLVVLSLAAAMVAGGCEKVEDLPFGPDDPFGQDAPSNLTDPALSWSADSYEATMGSENHFPTLTNSFGVGVTYESSQT